MAIPLDRRSFCMGGLSLVAGRPVVPEAWFTSGDDTGSALPSRKVFAHWHVFPLSFNNRGAAEDFYTDYMSPDGLNGEFRAAGGWLRDRPFPRQPRAEPDWQTADMADDIGLALAARLDGFQFNVLGVAPGNRHAVNLDNMLAAAARREAFEIMLSLDSLALKDVPGEDVVRRLVQWSRSPAVARSVDGRLRLGAFMPESWPVARWVELLDMMKAANAPVYFCPHFLDVEKAEPFFAIVEGCSVWGANHLTEFDSLKRFAAGVKARGKRWIAPIFPQDFRPKDGWFAEARNSELFREGWRLARETQAEEAVVATWNDYSEHSEIRPSEQIQFTFADLNSFYSAWFKTGTAPRPATDVLFYIHRLERTDDPDTGTSQPRRFFNRYDGEAANDIELLAFLTAPGALSIATSRGDFRQDAAAGITSMRAPLAVGKPRFALERAGVEIISLESAFAIRDASAYQDLLYRGGNSLRRLRPGASSSL